MKKFKIISLITVSLFLVLSIAGCSKNSTTTAPTSSKNDNSSKKLVVGFAQVGAESEWRVANTKSIKEAAEKANIELIFSDSKQKQENQISAIRSFIAQGVDFISFSAIVDSGFEQVLKEAKDAGIPVIFLDRKAKVDDSLFETFIGSNFYEEGKKSCKEMAQLLNNKGNIYEIQGNLGSEPATQRKKGFEDELKNFPEMKIVRSEIGDFVRQKGNEIMKSYLEAQNPKQDGMTDPKYKVMKSNSQAENPKIDGLFCHNDEMALGAVEEIEKAGLRPGKDIKIVSVDAVSKEALEMILKGKINASAECNPFLGPLLFETIRDIHEGKKVPKLIYSKEDVITAKNAEQKLQLLGAIK